MQYPPSNPNGKYRNSEMIICEFNPVIFTDFAVEKLINIKFSIETPIIRIDRIPPTTTGLFLIIKAVMKAPTNIGRYSEIRYGKILTVSIDKTIVVNIPEQNPMKFLNTEFVF